MNFSVFLRGQPTSFDLYTMEEIDEILESLPKDEGARRRVLEWIEQTANESTEERDDNQLAWSEQETESSEDEALAKGAKHQGVTAALGRLPRSGKVSEGPTAALGGPSNSGTQSIVSRGARSALGRPLYSAGTPSRGSTAEGSDIEGSTAQTEHRGKWPLGRPRHAKGVSSSDH